jgi:hypothetical protein
LGITGIIGIRYHDVIIEDWMVMGGEYLQSISRDRYCTYSNGVLADIDWLTGGRVLFDERTDARKTMNYILD